MNDINDLFSQVARSTDADPSPDVVEADIERGHQALAHRRRQRTRRVVAGVTMVAVIAAGVLVASQLGDSDATPPANVAEDNVTTQPSAAQPATPASEAQQAISVKLIAYTGKQLDGFTVDRVPEGWRLSGSTQYALTINPPGGTNENPDVFLGKLTVLLQSQDASGFPDGDAVTVNGQPGVVTNFDQQALTYNDGNGHTIVIQAPDELAWSSAQIVNFAEGVHVTSNAIAGHG